MQNHIREATVAKKPGRRGEHDISRKTIACGDAGRFRCTRCYSCAFYHYNCTRGRGCNGHPAFPTPSLGRKILNASGASRRENEVVCETIATSLRAQRSNPSFFARQDGLLRSARNDGLAV